MKTSERALETVDGYITQSGFAPELQEELQTLRRTILEAAPGAKEKIGYQMPAFEWNGSLVYFAVFRNHIGFYPGASGVAAFQEELSAYKPAKGTVQFPLGRPLPYELIARIVRFRVEENREKAARRAEKRKAEKRKPRKEGEGV